MDWEKKCGLHNNYSTSRHKPVSSYPPEGHIWPKGELNRVSGVTMCVRVKCGFIREKYGLGEEVRSP
jgi:hypothetical protein